jgi:hypothetical protein
MKGSIEFKVGKESVRVEFEYSDRVEFMTIVSLLSDFFNGEGC